MNRKRINYQYPPKCYHLNERKTWGTALGDERNSIFQTGWECPDCGRVRHIPPPSYQRNRVHPLAILIPLGLAAFLLAYWWLINFQ